MRINKYTAFRIYTLKSGKKAVFFNTRSRQYIFLEGLSAELFELLYSGDNEKLVYWCNENDIDIADTVDFTNQLSDLGLLAESDNEKEYSADNEYSASSSDDPQNLSKLNDLMEELYENGLLYSLHIDLTNHCNERCIHCYHPFDEYNYSNELSFDDVKTLVDDAYNLGVFSIVLSGGEAMLRKDFFDILEYISDKGISVTLFTNGVLLTEQNVKRLSQYRISVISISIYGDTAELHDKITTVKGSFIKTLEGIEQLKKYNLQFDLKCVMLAENAERIEEIRQLCKNLNFGRECILDFTLCGKLNGDCGVLDHRVSNETLKKIYFSDPERYIGEKENYNRSPESIPCGAGRHGLYCSADGGIYPCVSFRLYLCNFKELKNIQQSKTLKQWQNTRVSDIKGCFDHSYCKYCVEQCAGNNLIENNDYLNGETSHCDRAKIISEWFEKFSSIV